MREIVLRCGVAALLVFGASGARAQEPSAGSASEARAPSDELLRRALFTVEVDYPPDNKSRVKDTTDCVQVGFFITDDLGVTSAAGLAQAKSVRIKRLGEKRTSNVERLGVDVVGDLALLRLVRPKDPAPSTGTDTPEPKEAAATKPSPNPLSADSATPALDASMWTLFFDPSSAGSERIVPLSELVQLPKSGPNSTATPLTMRSVREVGLLGGLPIVDVDGRLAGMWRSMWPKSPVTEPKLVSVTELRQFASKALAQRPDTSPDATQRSFTLPLLRWGGSASDSAACNVAKNLRDRFRCGECNGRGFKEEPDVRFNPAGATKTINRVDCPECKRSCLAKADPFWTLTREAAIALTKVAATEKLKRELEAGVAEAAALNPAEFVARLKDHAKEELGPKRVRGRALCFTIPRGQWPDEDSSMWQRNVRIVESPEYGSLLFNAPEARSVIQEGCDAFVVAVVAGTWTVGDHTYVVLDRGIVVPIKSAGSRAGR